MTKAVFIQVGGGRVKFTKLIEVGGGRVSYRVTCCCGVLLRGSYVHFWNKSSCYCSDNPAFSLVIVSRGDWL